MDFSGVVDPQALMSTVFSSLSCLSRALQSQTYVSHAFHFLFWSFINLVKKFHIRVYCTWVLFLYGFYFFLFSSLFLLPSSIFLFLLFIPLSSPLLPLPSPSPLPLLPSPLLLFLLPFLLLSPSLLLLPVSRHLPCSPGT